MGDRLTTVDMGRKVGGCCAPFREDIVSDIAIFVLKGTLNSN